MKYIFFTFLFSGLTGGCMPRVITAKDRIDVYIDDGPPCLVRLEADGKLLAKAKHETACKRVELHE